MEIEMEIRQLKDENQALRCRLKETEEVKLETDALVVELQGRIKIFENNIQFLKGQIEAYQYCVSNMR